MKLPQSVHNRVSYVGILIIILALIAFVFLLILQTTGGQAGKPYAAVVTFVAVPAFMVLGMALVPIGMIRERRHIQRTGVPSAVSLPVIDLNDPRHRNASLIVLVGALFLLFTTAFGSYQAFEATESVSFCGLLCHSVMHPEYTAYEHSPHARVSCVGCHVGPGAGWYVRSKLSGLYQVYAITFGTYPKPIPAPITNLRPAQETCEQCHWPDKFFEQQLRKQIHFLSDEQNSRWEIDLLIKTGGGGLDRPQAGGIHWHMNIQNKVEYIAVDEKRQQIPWVRVTNRATGYSREYMSTENPMSEQDRAVATVRRMDCIDCHNRPSHIYLPPRTSVNQSMAVARIDPTLPFVKAQSVEVLAADYASTDAAMRAIEQGLRSFYEEKYPDIADKRGGVIRSTIAEVQQIYRNNFFPEMKVRWDVYPNNIGHLMFPGCFRCHDGKHQTADGRVLSKECTQCHAILAEGKPDGMKYADDRVGLTFEHPVDIGSAWQEMACSECHTGGAQ
jgi:hypothetical protein